MKKNKYITIDKDKELELSHDDLISKIEYDKDTGIFKWRYRVNPAIRKDMIAGCKSNKYWVISINGNTYYANRLAWFYHHKSWPEFMCDHINGNEMDNRIINLIYIIRNGS